jgi:hypothetical protein
LKIDFHVHTKFSPDSFSEPARLVRAAVRKGLGGIAITDHGTFGAVAEAREAAKKIAPKLVVIGGEEVLTDRGEVLCLFISRAIKSRKFEDVCRETHSQGGIVAIPHPFDQYRRFRLDPEKLSKTQLAMADAVEAYNSRVPRWGDNEKALLFALKHGKAVIGGSDAHFVFELGTSCAHVFASTEEGAKRCVLQRKSSATGTRSRTRPFFVHGLTKAAKRVKDKFFKKGK